MVIINFRKVSFYIDYKYSTVVAPPYQCYSGTTIMTSWLKEQTVFLLNQTWTVKDN